MHPLKRTLLCATCCALTLVFQANVFGQNPAPESSRNTVASNAGTSEIDADSELPDSPGTSQAKSEEQSNSSTSSSPAQSSQSSSASGSSTPVEQGQKLQRPVGTAAAEAPKVSGVTAAQPAGIAIAPAKQRKIRVIVLKVGAIVGAGAALGTVIALSRSTPSKPPGAR